MHAYGSVESREEYLVKYPILDENLVDKIIKIIHEENIVAHILLLEATMAQCSPTDHFLEQIQLPFLPDMDDDDNLKEEIVEGCQTKLWSLLVSE